MILVDKPNPHILMENSKINESQIIKYARLLFFFCSASFFPLCLISSGNAHFFSFISVPIFSINSGLLFHQMVTRHVLLQINRIEFSKSYITLLLYYLTLYAVGVGWAQMFIDNEENIKVNGQVFLLLPIINGFICVLFFSLRYFNLNLSQGCETVFDEQSSGLANLSLQVKKQYDEVLVRKNTMKKQLQDRLRINKELQDNLNITPLHNNVLKDMKIDSPIRVVHQRSNSDGSGTANIFSFVTNSLAKVEKNIQNKDTSKDVIERLSQKNLSDLLRSITINTSQNVRFIRVMIGLYCIFVGIILQIIFSVNIANTFQFLLDQSYYFIYLICLSYPVLIGLIKLIPTSINSAMKLRYEWQIQFLSLFFASLPYRGLYLQFNSYQFGFGIIIIKFFYKLLIYYLQFKYAGQIFDFKEKLKNIKKNKKKQSQKKESEIVPISNRNEPSDVETCKKEVEFGDMKSNKEIGEMSPSGAIESMTNRNQSNIDENKLINKQDDICAYRYSEVEQNLEVLKEKGQKFYEMVYKLEMIQFSDILHMICVYITFLLNAYVNTASDSIHSVQTFKNHLTAISVLFAVELIAEFFYTLIVTYSIGKTQDFCTYSFTKFMNDIHNFSKKQFRFIFASILCSYSILFIVLNN